MNYDDLPIDFDFFEDSIESLELGCYIGFSSHNEQYEDTSDEDVHFA